MSPDHDITPLLGSKLPQLWLVTLPNLWDRRHQHQGHWSCLPVQGRYNDECEGKGRGPVAHRFDNIYRRGIEVACVKGCVKNICHTTCVTIQRIVAGLDLSQSWVEFSACLEILFLGGFKSLRQVGPMVIQSRPDYLSLFLLSLIKR